MRGPGFVAVLFAALIAFGGAPVSTTMARPLGALDEDDVHCPQGAVCGTVMRPVDPAGVVPGQLAIVYRLYTHTGPHKAGVIVAQEGGPGYTTTGSAFSYLMLLAPLRAEYDILMVNARGTGTTALVCPSLDKHPVRTPGDIGECGRRLGPASVLYGTRLAVNDMKAVLDTLHIAEFNLYADSYGTYFGQVFAALYPAMLRSVVLDGAFPVRGLTPWYPENAVAMQNGLRNSCARTPYCAALPGRTMDRIRAFVDAVRTHPIHGQGPDGDGTVREVTVDPASVGAMLWGGSGPLIFRDLDAAVRAYFDNGDAAPILRMAAENDANEDPAKPPAFSYGLFAAVSCMDYPQIYDMRASPARREEQRVQAIADQRRKDARIYDPLSIAEFETVALDTSLLDMCLQWPVQHPPYTPGRPIPAGLKFTSAPTLVINGELDTLTAVGGGNVVAAQFPNAVHVVVANSFHVDALYDTDDCAQEIVRRFLVTLNPGDVSCAANIRPLRLVPFFPRHAHGAIPAVAQTGNEAARVDLALASAAVQTAGDVIARWYINYRGTSVGLHGGTWSYAGAALVPHFTLNKVQWVRDFAVSGDAVWNGNDGSVHATLTYVNWQGEKAHLTADWNDRDHLAMAQLSGTVGGRAIRATMPAP